ncbi:Outer membrane protein assembly factor BamB, contains PQQ-like beta-propeller repeat [Halomicrobium zhouii]|uniref:Outer membrane protein assembly factor BamB, contains PQQ-like beta-propeller repeat n=1 Tax=Halomicrobium zhouii TaxID=767519 RepID=A0A1I6LI45_9EURY|nr:PQQ-binding-like beta-propeller repeat protein [Halomicrobium zhouii]SFS03157.1 Outer membrane protein assembly factor BamB, contains PQQ-like beta-propeller repeat [Halomicrobium zhouii]
MVDLHRRAYLRAVTAAVGGATAATGIQSGALERVAAQTDADGQSGSDGFSQAAPWSQGGAGAANTGAAPTSGPRTDLQVEWSYTDVDAWGLASSPALVDGVLYFASLDSDIGDSGRVHAVDASDGSARWQFETDMRHETTPAVHEGRVFVGDGELLALDTEDGTELWRSEAVVRGSVRAANGTVYAATDDNVITAFDAADGTEQWRFDPATDSVDWSAYTAPAVAGGTVYASARVNPGDGDLRSVGFALDAETGDRQWATEFPAARSGGAPAPAVSDGSVYVDVGDLFALDAATGDVQWSASDVDSPVVQDGAVYALRDGGAFVALDAATGEQQWQTVWETERDPGGRTELVATEDTLYVGTFIGGVFAFDAESGEQLGQAPDGGFSDGRCPPTVAGGTAFLGVWNADSGLYAITEGDGSSGSTEPPAPEVELRTGPDQSYCVGSQITFIREASGPGSTNDFGQDDYTWKMDFDTGDGESGASEPMTETAGELVRHTYDEPGTYEVAVVGEGPDGRTARDTVTVDIAECAGPTARIATDPADAERRDFALMDEVTFSAEPSEADAGVERYEWDLDGDGEFEKRGDAETVVLGEECREETLTVSLRVVDTQGATDTASVSVSTMADDA